MDAGITEGPLHPGDHAFQAHHTCRREQTEARVRVRDRPALTFANEPRLHPLSSSVLSSKAGLSRPASCVHTGPLLVLSLEGGDGVFSLRTVCGEAGDLEGLVTIARSSPLSHREPSTLACWHRIPGHLSVTKQAFGLLAPLRQS